MAKISQFKTSKDAESKGTWVLSGGMKLLIARHGNPEYLKWLRNQGKALAPGIRHGDDGAREQLEALALKATARYILLDWRDMEDEAGQAIPYSTDAAEKVFTDYPDFYRMVLELAQDAANFKQQVTEDELGN